MHGGLAFYQNSTSRKSSIGQDQSTQTWMSQAGSLFHHQKTIQVHGSTETTTQPSGISFKHTLHLFFLHTQLKFTALIRGMRKQQI
jgi:hypothetical protein